MSDPFRHIRPGDPLRGNISAEGYNAALDAGRAFKNKAKPLPGDQFSTRQAGIVSVLNESGSTVDQFGILQISAPIIDPADNEDSFTQRVTFTGAAPDLAYNVGGGRIVITLEPIASGKIGKCVADGVSIAKITLGDVAAADVHAAEAEDGNLVSLVPLAGGSIQVLWVATAGDDPRWCIVRIGGLAPTCLFPVKVSKTGGADGTATSAASWTYTVKDLAGVELETDVVLTRPRPNGSMTVQADDSYGTAFFAADGTLKLWDAGEIEDTTPCSIEGT